MQCCHWEYWVILRLGGILRLKCLFSLILYNSLIQICNLIFDTNKNMFHNSSKNTKTRSNNVNQTYETLTKLELILQVVYIWCFYFWFYWNTYHVKFQIQWFNLNFLLHWVFAVTDFLKIKCKNRTILKAIAASIMGINLVFLDLNLMKKVKV